MTLYAITFIANIFNVLINVSIRRRINNIAKKWKVEDESGWLVMV